MIRISISGNLPYINKVHQCLTMLEKNANPEIEIDFIGIDFDPKPYLPYSRINTFTLDSSKVRCKNQHNSPQYGDFIEVYSDLSDNDVIIFIDGDVLLQRPLSKDELDRLSNYSFGYFGVNYNAGMNDNLLFEGTRIFLTRPVLDLQISWWPDGKIPPCYNTGVCVATKATWKLMADTFSKYWEKEKLFFSAPSAQWLMSWIVTRIPEFKVDVLPTSFHTHGHFGLFPNIHIGLDGTTSDSGQVCLFRHKIHWDPNFPAPKKDIDEIT